MGHYLPAHVPMDETGVFFDLFEELIAKQGVGSLIIDGTIVAVHQDATGAHRNQGDPRSQAIGKSRGGRTTKIIAACDENGQVFNILVVPGNDNEGPYTANFTRGIDADHFIGDKAYDSGPLLEEIAQRGTEITGPASKQPSHTAHLRQGEVQNAAPHRKRLSENEAFSRDRDPLQKNSPNVHRADNPDPHLPGHQDRQKRPSHGRHLATQHAHRRPRTIRPLNTCAKNTSVPFYNGGRISIGSHRQTSLGGNHPTPEPAETPSQSSSLASACLQLNNHRNDRLYGSQNQQTSLIRSTRPKGTVADLRTLGHRKPASQVML